MPRRSATSSIDRRQLILEAALSVFAEQGFEAATNKEIAERAGVNQGLIYFYFESKADMFFAAFEHHARFVMAELDVVFEQERDEEPASGLAQLLRQIVAILDTPRTINLLRIVHQVVGGRVPDGALGSKEKQLAIGLLAEHIGRRLREYLQAQMARGTLRPVKAGLTAYLMTSTLFSSLGARRQSHPMQLSQQELAEGIATLFCYGLLPRDESTEWSGEA